MMYCTDDDETAAREAASLLASLSDVHFTPLKGSGGLFSPPSLHSPPLLSSTATTSQSVSMCMATGMTYS